MYTRELHQKRIKLNSIFLDPNNPRFPDKRTKVPAKRFIDDDVQQKAGQRISVFGIRELTNSIIRNGFLPLDRIVVRQIAEQPGCYVVVEGNRRLAALRQVIQEINDDEIEAEDLDDEYLVSLKESLQEIDCLVYIGSDHDIAWILQGVRHLSGIRDWSPSQKAELVAKEIDERGLKYKAVGEMLGMTAQQVGKYYRAYSALIQMRNDPDFGDRYDTSLFTLFDEAYSKMAIRKWLDWKEEEKIFGATDNLKRFYSWITKEPDRDNERRIHDPRQMRQVAKLVENPKHSDLLQKIDDGEITFEQAEARITANPGPVNWKLYLEQAEESLKKVPMFTEDAEGLVSGLEKLQKVISSMLKQATSAKDA